MLTFNMRLQTIFQAPWLPVFAVLFMCASGVTARAEIIDRMLAVVDGQVVTAGDLRQYRALARLFGDSVPDDDGAALGRVIENILIEAQVVRFPGIRISDAEVDRYIASLPAAEAGAADVGPLAEETIREGARRRLERQRYFNLRFEQFIRASEREIAAYYTDVFVPAARREGLDPIPPLEEVEDLIRMNVIVEKTDRDIATWTESLFRRSEVEIVMTTVLETEDANGLLD